MMERRRIFIETRSKRVILRVKVADSFFGRMKGLMFAKRLGAGEGMLFVSDSEHKPTLWTLNMRFAIDMIFADSNGTIVDIVHGAQPWSAAPFKIYMPRRDAKYVIEVRAGFAKRNSVRVGDKLRF